MSNQEQKGHKVEREQTTKPVAPNQSLEPKLVPDLQLEGPGANTPETKKEEVCAYIKCPPLKRKGAQFVGKTVKQVREMIKDDLEIPDKAPTSISTDGGKTYSKANDEHVIKDGEYLEFGRTSSVKG